MATDIYKVGFVNTIDDVEIEISPLKIKYMKRFMETFNTVTSEKTEDQVLDILSECVRICMEQFCPAIATSVDEVQDSFDLQTVYKILDLAAGIKLNAEVDEEVSAKAVEQKEGSTWDTLDLAKLETEVFLLGIWKNYDELETSLCLAELMAILSTSRELTHEERKFSAAIQGIDLDSQSKDGEVKGQQEWENLKARVFSGGATADANDILALQGMNAQKAGFGIGMGLSYDNQVDPDVLVKN